MLNILLKRRQRLLKVYYFQLKQRNEQYSSVAAVQSRADFLIQRISKNSPHQQDIKCIRELSEILADFHDVRNFLIQSGKAVGSLLELKANARNQEFYQCCQTALTFFCHVDPVKGQGVRILALDEGGTRAIISIEILKRLQDLCHHEVLDMFDLVIGTSTGAILSFLLAIKQLPLNECHYIYERLSREIFQQNTIVGTGKLFWSHAYYDSSRLQDILIQEVGNCNTLIDSCCLPKTPKVAAVATLVNHAILQPYAFRNYTLRASSRHHYPGSSQHKVWEALQASTAAPGYFEEFKIGNDIFQDGGLLCNNPSALAINEAKSLWPSTPIQTLVSVGTGTYHGRGGPHTASFSSAKAKLMKVVASATDTEAVHSVLQDLMPDNTYFRFNPNISRDVALDECGTDTFNLLRRDANNYIAKFDHKFQTASKSLTQGKSKFASTADMLALWQLQYLSRR